MKRYSALLVSALLATAPLAAQTVIVTGTYEPVPLGIAIQDYDGADADNGALPVTAFGQVYADFVG